MSSKQQQQQADRERALALLRDVLKPGDTVYTVLEHVSRSGMSRRIKPLAVHAGEIARISRLAAKVTGYPLSRNCDTVTLRGCGMDMGYALVYELSAALFPDGFDCIGDDCPSNDHSNRVQVAHHADGGYALRHQWL